MDAVEIGKLQQEFLKGMSDSTARLAKQWSAAMRKAGLPQVPDKSFSVLECLVNPFGIGATSPSATTGFQRMLDLAVQDLPELLKLRGDAAKKARVTNRWVKSYEKVVRESFGIPEPSETEQLVKFWRSSLESLSGTHREGLFAGMFPTVVLPGWPLSPFFPREAAPGRAVFEAWTEAYAKTIGYLYPVSARGIPFEFREQTKRVVDAQMRFLKSLALFHEQMVETARKGLEKVIATIATLEEKDLTADVYKRFCNTWVTTHEKAFEDLFKSDTFSQVVTDTVQSALVAKTNMDALVEENLCKWNIPNRKHLDNLHEDVASIKKHVRRLEKEIQGLRQLVEQLLQQRA